MTGLSFWIKGRFVSFHLNRLVTLLIPVFQIVEFNTPWNLIQKEDGIFRNMCLKSGSFTELETIAKAKAEGLAVTSRT